MITGAVLKGAFISGANNIQNHRKDVDALNVFPVPDGDTGTNMTMTVSAAVRELLVVDDGADVSVVASKIASALLRGARGNSGVILSLIFRGISNGLKGLQAADSRAFACALDSGRASAYKAVMKPTEGTILTVIRKIASAVEGTDEAEDCAALFNRIVEAGNAALTETPELLPVLKEAGVVDAGGQGLMHILEGMCSFIADGRMIESGDGASVGQVWSESAAAAAPGDIKFTYCSEFLINCARDAGSTPLKLKAYLESVGDCVVVVEDEDIVKVHVHSNEPGNIIQEALKVGQLSNIKIDNMRVQHRNARLGAPPEKRAKAVPVPGREEPVKAYGFVAVAAGAGFEKLFKELGCDRVVAGGQTMNPSTDDILSAIEATPARHVFVLPNNKNIIMAAEQTVHLADRGVSVLATRSIPQGIAALLGFDGELRPDENHLRMMKAAENVHTAQVTFAARDSVIGGQRIKEGQILGMEDGRVTLVEDDMLSAAYRVIRRLIKKYGGTLVTVFYGENTDGNSAAVLSERLQERFPNMEVNVIDGGQPVYYFIASVE